jgi:Holliday junction DNA helicase RuvB
VVKNIVCRIRRVGEGVGEIRKIRRKKKVQAQRSIREILHDYSRNQKIITTYTTPQIDTSKMFSFIYGHDDIKQLYSKSLLSLKPIHIILIGPPATAKSLFLEEIATLDNSLYLLGGTSTKAGIRDLIFDHKPQYIIIDEIDKIRSAADLSVLLSIMESGRLVSAKHENFQQVVHKCWVFAAGNRTTNIRPELLSRFWKIFMPVYSDEDLYNVITKVLVAREGTSSIMAEYIANAVIDDLRSKDPRDAIKIARISQNQKDVDWAVGIMKKYDRNSLGRMLLG